ncbi:MAG TPA: hypothetical protein VFG56_00920, partial [Candidatus Saccharimonadales bacterium]|nr:hypothetical protein [Candidatus Saccharimonadales bacterium]
MFALGHLTAWLDVFARSGGGGSSSGGGGGDGIIAFIGYLPMHFIGAKLRKHGFNRDYWFVFQVVGWIIGILYALFWLVVWHVLGFLIGVAAIVGTGAGL